MKPLSLDNYPKIRFILLIIGLRWVDSPASDDIELRPGQLLSDRAFV